MNILAQVSKQTNDNKIEVIISDDLSCGQNCNCASKNTKVRKMEVNNSLNAEIGDLVLIETPVNSGLIPIILYFVLPIVLMVAGYFIGNALFPSPREGENPMAIASSFAGLFVYFGLLFIANTIVKRNAKFQPAMSKIINDPCELDGHHH